MDKRDLRNCFGHFATGVTVVTWNGEETNRRGITVNSFTSVSLDPPLVLVSIDENTRAYEELRDQPFVVNILASDQEDVAMQFAGRPQEGFEVQWEADTDCGPVLAHTVATIECTPWAQYEGGDHLLFVGKVEDYTYSAKESLLFHKGKFLTTLNDSIVSQN